MTVIELLLDHGFWIAMGSLLYALIMTLVRRNLKGREPQQFGDDVR